MPLIKGVKLKGTREKKIGVMIGFLVLVIRLFALVRNYIPIGEFV